MLTTILAIAAASSPVYLTCEVTPKGKEPETVSITVDEANGTVNEDGISYTAQFKPDMVLYGRPQTGGARAIDRSELVYVRLGSTYMGVVMFQPAHGPCKLVEPPADRKF